MYGSDYGDLLGMIEDLQEQVRDLKDRQRELDDRMDDIEAPKEEPTPTQ